ncbi:MAG: hypothetical protein Tsb009_11280 [Planctomycetaceae bacterium]
MSDNPSSTGHRVFQGGVLASLKDIGLRCVEPLPAKFPATLEQDQKESIARRNLLWAMLGLMTLTVLPRIILAYRIDAVCDDAYYYISVANAWKHSEFKIALQYLNINVYPFILWGLNSLGMDWVFAGKIWGVLISGLTIPPLFGLVRILYNERVAFAACFLFAVHPELIEAAIEPIRGPTFWFFFMMSLYTSLQAARLGRWRYYLLAGFWITLAIHTRAEGWILIAPLAMWSVLLRKPDVSRKRVTLGLISAATMVPLFLVLVNITLLRQNDEWQWGRLTHFRHFQEWLRSEVSKENIHVSAAKPSPWSNQLMRKKNDVLPVVAPKPKHILNALKAQTKTAAPTKARVQSSATKVVPSNLPPMKKAIPAAGSIQQATSSPFRDGRWITYIKQISRKFEPFNLIFMLFGVCGWWREMFRRDKIVMLLVFVGLMLAIWVRLSQIGDMNGRYFFSAYLVAIAFSALGLLSILRKLTVLSERLIHSSRTQQWAPTAVLLGLMAIYWGDSLTAQHRERRAQAKLGIWVHRELGPFDSVMVDRAATRVGYFAFGTMPTLSYYFSSSGDGAEYGTPDLLILTRKLSKPEERVFIYQQIERMNLIEIHHKDIPESGQQFMIFARRPLRSVGTTQQTARRNAADSSRQ